MPPIVPASCVALRPSGPPSFRLWRGVEARCVKAAHRASSQAAASSVAEAPVAAPASPPLSAAAPPSASHFVSWPGLLAWRASALDLRTHWGQKGPVVPEAAPPQAQPLPASLAECARAVLLTADPLGKAELTHRAWRAYCEGRLPLGAAEPLQGPPARPERPQLVPARQIPSMDRSPLPKNAYMLHNLAHVELNAVDLAWDTVLRFSGCGLPEAFYSDFARVADDESRHLSWCLQRLRELGHEYGCMPAHNLLWEGAEASSGDLGARLAIVPMSQEARGLDAGDRLTNRLVGMGDNRTAAIVRRIAEEERAHVAVGVTWFQAICAALGQEPGPAFRGLILELCPGLLRGPFNDAERAVVGLPREFYDVALWPEAEATAAKAAVEAAMAAERAGHAAAGAGAGAGEGAMASPPSSAQLVPLGDPVRLHQLVARLGAMLDLEVANASMAQ